MTERPSSSIQSQFCNFTATFLIDQMAEVHPVHGFELLIKCHIFFFKHDAVFFKLYYNLIHISSILNTNIINYIHVSIEERNRYG